MTHHARCDECGWRGPTRENRARAKLDRRTHLFLFHNFRSPAYQSDPPAERGVPDSPQTPPAPDEHEGVNGLLHGPKAAARPAPCINCKQETPRRDSWILGGPQEAPYRVHFCSQACLVLWMRRTFMEQHPPKSPAPADHFKCDRCGLAAVYAPGGVWRHLDSWRDNLHAVDVPAGAEAGR